MLDKEVGGQTPRADGTFSAATCQLLPAVSIWSAIVVPLEKL